MSESQFGNWCRHCNGLVNTHCKADVRYEDVRDSESHPYRWPCFKSDGCPERCALVSYPTPEEIKAHDEEVAALLQEFARKLENNICPQCDRPIERKEQVGRCVYALPCHHRLYQGRLPRQEPKLHPYLREQVEQEKRERP